MENFYHLNQELDAKAIQEIISRSTDALVLILFRSDWHGSAHIMETFLAEILADIEEGVYAYCIDFGENNKFATRFKVNQVPSLLFLRGEKVVYTIIGLVGKSRLRNRIDELMA